MTLPTLHSRASTSWLLPCSILLVIGAANLSASGITGDYIVGQWGSPVFNGCLADAVDHSLLTCEDTTSTAVYSFSNAALNAGPLAKSILSQGANSNPAPGVPAADLITFIGGTIPATHDSVPFVIGGIAFTNGTSEGTTEIFGATLNLFASNGSTAQFIGSETVQINATINSGTDAQNADYLTFSGVTGLSFNVYEGTTASGSLFGEIIGDPQTLPACHSIPASPQTVLLGPMPPCPQQLLQNLVAWCCSEGVYLVVGSPSWACRQTSRGDFDDVRGGIWLRNRFSIFPHGSRNGTRSTKLS